MTDQQRADTCHGSNYCKTPNIDAFKAEGIDFKQAFCPSPHCCPSRATFFTGLYPSQHGIWNNVNVANALSHRLNDNVRMFSEDLKEAGYNLTFSGKWHVSSYEGPKERGWNEAQVTANGDPNKPAQDQFNWDLYRMLSHNAPDSFTRDRREGEIIRPGYPDYIHYGSNENPFGDQQVVHQAIETIKNRTKSDQPWCQYVGTLGPHDPYCPPQEFIDMYDLEEIQLPDNFSDTMKDKPALYQRTRVVFDQLSEEEHKKAILHYLAFCSYEDFLFGQLLKALDESGDRENTLVLYLSDHGDYMAEHGLWCKGLMCFKSAYHIPAIARWPDGIKAPGREVDSIINLADFAPTFSELVGKKPDPSLIGNSLIPFFRDEAAPISWREAHFTQSNGNELYGIQRSITTNQWKYVYNGFDYDELYDLGQDPLEVKNLAKEKKYQPLIKELCARIWEFAYRSNDNAFNPYIMVGLAPLGPGSAFTDPRMEKS